jgi:hypothetical protein
VAAVVPDGAVYDIELDDEQLHYYVWHLWGVADDWWHAATVIVHEPRPGRPASTRHETTVRWAPRLDTVSHLFRDDKGAWFVPAELLADAGKPDEPGQMPTLIAETILGLRTVTGSSSATVMQDRLVARPIFRRAKVAGSSLRA